jgi:nicotinate phosphoribosyltransferase
VVAGTGRLLQQLRAFRFGDDELRYLRDNRVVGRDAALPRGLPLHGTIRGYREGELYFPGSPVLTVEGTFAEAVVLETLALSILNHDSAVANAAARMSIAAGDRPLAEMGSRAPPSVPPSPPPVPPTSPGSARRATSRRARVGHPHDGHRRARVDAAARQREDAFRSQIEALGTDTTLLIDTYDIRTRRRDRDPRRRHGLGGVRIDSGDLPTVAAEVRAQLDELGATGTRITVTSDLDEFAIAALAASPSTPTASGRRSSPDRARRRRHGLQARRTPGCRGRLGRGGEGLDRQGVRGAQGRVPHPVRGTATSELIAVSDGFEQPDGGGASRRARPAGDARRPRRADPAFEGPAASLAREHHAIVREELPVTALALSRSDPALPTVYVDA